MKVFDSMGKSGNIVFGIDYNLPDAVKSLDRQRRRCGDQLILKGEANKRQPDWN